MKHSSSDIIKCKKARAKLLGSVFVKLLRLIESKKLQRTKAILLDIKDTMLDLGKYQLTFLEKCKNKVVGFDKACKEAFKKTNKKGFIVESDEDIEGNVENLINYSYDNNDDGSDGSDDGSRSSDDGSGSGSGSDGSDDGSRSSDDGSGSGSGSDGSDDGSRSSDDGSGSGSGSEGSDDGSRSSDDGSGSGSGSEGSDDGSRSSDDGSGSGSGSRSSNLCSRKRKRSN